MSDPKITPPADAAARRAKKPVLAYPLGSLPRPDMALVAALRASLKKVDEVIVPPRDGGTFRAKRGQFFRIVSIEGPQVGDLNLWNADDLSERFFSGKTRQLHATHISTGDSLWSTMPYMRRMATITHDTLAWYGYDEDGGGIHDVIGTRCDPYTKRLLVGIDYHTCCHSNISRALAKALGKPPREIEHHVHDVMNVFMCTGFTKDTHQYFAKASPVRPGDFIEFMAEIDLIGGLSACPVGDCGETPVDQEVTCYPLKVEVFTADPALVAKWPVSQPSAYPRSHGMG